MYLLLLDCVQCDCAGFQQLETELRKLQSVITEAMAAFDENLNQLFLKKIKVMMVLYQVHFWFGYCFTPTDTEAY
jgi:hypothetical protein